MKAFGLVVKKDFSLGLWFEIEIRIEIEQDILSSTPPCTQNFKIMLPILTTHPPLFISFFYVKVSHIVAEIASGDENVIGKNTLFFEMEGHGN